MPAPTPKTDDAAFMMECLRHLTTPASVNGAAVAAACGYNNTASAANRIYKLRKTYGLNITVTNCEAGGTNSPAVTTTTPKKRKAKGVADEKEESDDDDVIIMETPSKRVKGKKR